ncbi:IKI3 family protein isoform 1 [Theobroma cacao]|nr:IKI3 family protein isoform 1 [Theobroma cacao]EOY18198.1 IKI3 family protein isoform 1 [Theobroma cacao]
MKNLKLYSEITSNLELQSEGEVLLFAAYDIESNRFFFASSDNLIYTLHLSSFQNERAWTKGPLQAEIDPLGLEPEDVITSFDYLMEKEALIVGTSSGLLLLHNVDGKETEVVGQVEGGVKCISPSPDGDLLGVTTGLGQLLVMTHDWDLLYETALEDHPEGVDVRELDFLSRDVLGSPISWRGDGKYFATLSEMPNSSLKKRLKVWERDTGALHASSEPKELMGAILEWMPSGAKIAAVCDRKPEAGPSIVFYERNGLERSSFCINEPVDATVELLKWNCSSDLLAAIVRSGNYDSVKIWFFCNNHWYLKQEIKYLRKDGVRFMWDPTKPQQLISWTLGGQVTVYKFIWVAAVIGDSTALVIDDSKILVTPLSLSLLPPPMYLFSLNFPSAVREMAFYSTKGKNCLAALLSNGCLCVAELPAPDTWEELEGKEFSVEPCVSATSLGSFVHLIWLDSHMLLAVSHYGFNHSNCSFQTPSSEDRLCGFYLQEIELACYEDNLPGLLTCSGWHAKVSYQNLLEGLVMGIVPNPAKRCAAFVQFDGGEVFEYTSKLGITRRDLKHDEISFSSSCPWMNVVLVGVSEQSQHLLFGLDDMGRLHVGRRILCSNCSSFSFYSNLADNVITHLILATKQDLLFIVDISDILHGKLELTYENFVHIGSKRKEEDNINYINIWEKGAKVVGVLHGDEAAVILQTNRGNLECIYPRKLVLASIVNALNQKRFKDALLIVRRHRIDFNVIVDYCGLQAFLQSASEFVRQVNNLSYITEFVCAIKTEKMTETLYKKFFSLPYCKEQKDLQANDLKGSDASLDATNKVSSVLLAIRRALGQQVPESPARELCILTTLARSDPPALEEALERVKVIREMELLDSDDPRRMNCPSSEEALKHLLWLSVSDAVFEAALGLYDLNLAAIVALNSQRDPKEFLPFLQELDRLPVLLMRYNIDLRLRRFEKALRHIVSAGDAHFADCMNLVKKNPQLFPLGLQLITDPIKRGQVLEAWGDHLSDEKCFDDAAATYLCCSSLPKALKAYRECGNWSGVLTVAGLIKLEKDEVMQLAHELCEELQALGKPGEAGKIALEYCGDISVGINLLISARDWEEALRVAFLHRREDLVSEVKNASLDCASSLIDDYKEGLEKVGKYLARYLAVRQRRLLLAAKLQAEERSINDIDDDTASEASSTFSGMSVYTTGTRKSSAASTSSTVASKARDARRQRSRGKIRPGSPGEEMALVEHLKGMSLTAGAKSELKSLLVSLVMLGKEETARKLQHVGENFQLSHMAAVRLAEDTMSNDSIDERAHTLERYVQKVKAELQDSDAFSWRCRVFLSP